MGLFNPTLISKAVTEAKIAPKRPYPLMINNYPACCGSRVLTSFPYKKNAERVELALKNIMERDGFKRYQLHATLAGTQYSANREVLEKFGFVEAGAFTNPNTSHKCHAFVYSPAKKTKIF